MCAKHAGRAAFLLAIGVLICGTSMAQAQAQAAASEPAAPQFNPGDTAWMLTSTTLVLLMTIPGLALFYGGLVRSKNVLSTLMHSLFCAMLVSVIWVLFGYSLAFGPTVGGIIGDLKFALMRNVLHTASAGAPTIPQILFVAYQATFAIITPALISGAFAERMRFGAYALFVLLWSTLIYAPLAHWVWGGGFIGTQIGALDFAGGTVVHISSGISALVTAVFIGKRIGYGDESMSPHSLPLTVVGASLLWVGWFGFNAGSAVSSGELASTALVNTNTAAAAAALAWLLADYWRTGKPTVLGAASGAVAGLVAITPAAGFVEPYAAILIGLLGGAGCYFAVTLKPRIGYDDALDVVGVHMVGGTIGALATGVFATSVVNPAIKDLTLGLTGGLIDGHPALVGKQFLAVLITYAYCGIGTLVILLVVNALFKVRAAEADEVVGLDLSQHSERAYAFMAVEPVTAAARVEPRAAMTPPAGGERFTVQLGGIEPERVREHWRMLCQERPAPVTPEFRAVYAHFTTLRNASFRFRGGDREELRRALESIFKALSPAVTARVES